MEALVHLPAVMVAGSAAFMGFSFYSASAKRDARRLRLQEADHQAALERTLAAYANVVAFTPRPDEARDLAA